MADAHRIAEKMTRARKQLLATVEGLTDQEMAWAPAGEWSICEILHHIAIGEAANLQLVTRAIAGEPVVMEGFDLDAWNVAQVAQYADQPASVALERLQSTRQDTLQILQNLSEQELAVSLDHPGWGEMTVEQLLRALGLHDQMHRRDILKRIEQLKARR